MTDLVGSSPVYSASSSGFGQRLSGGSASIATANQPLPTNSIWSIRCRVTTTASSLQVAVSQASAFWIGVNTGGVLAMALGGGAAINSSKVINDGNPHEVLMCWNGSTSYLYCDGTQVATGSIPPVGPADASHTNYTNWPFYLREYGAVVGSYTWSGTVDEVQIFSTCLQTGSSYTAPTTPGAVTDAGCIHLWHLDGNLYDMVGQATALTVTPSSQSVTVGTASANYTVGANGQQYGGTVTLSDGGAGGTFTPSSVTLASGSSATATFTYTAASAGTKTLTASSSALTGISISGTATAVATGGSTATALAISPSSQTTIAGVATGNYTVSVNGSLASSTSVALSDGGAGGTFTPSSITLAAGSSSTATFTYTNATAGTRTLTAAATGLTSATASAVVAVFLTPANASVVASPHNWVTGLSNSTTSDNSAARACHSGAYMRVYVSGTTSLGVVFGASSTTCNFMVQIDGGLPSAPVAALNSATYNVTLPDTGAHVVTFTVYSVPDGVAGRWAGTLGLVINGFQLGSGGVGGTAVRGTKRLLIYGDSITEGIASHDGSNGITTGYAFLIGEAFRASGGWEYSIKGAGGSGYCVTAAGGAQPPAWTSGNDAQSSWNKVDGSGAAGAALTTGTSGGASERFAVQPDLILEVWGTNDGLQSVADATVTATVTGLYQRMRVAAPNAVILKIVPFSGWKRSAIAAGLAALTDGKIITIDPQTDARMTATGYCGNLLTGASSGQTVHPWSLGAANLTALLLAPIMAAYVPFATARAFGSAS